MTKRITITDVARLAGVSLMSVSRAMNNRPGLSEETRQRILQIAAEIGFRPSQIARGLATRRTSTLGLVMPDVANPFFAQIARGAEDVAYQHGYSVFFINTAEDVEREKSALDSLWQKEIDGAILCSPRLLLDELNPYIARFLATVLVNRELDAPIPGTATINVDDRLGAQIAVQHFLKQGRKRIAFAAGPGTSVSNQRRLDGYRQGLDSAQREFNSSLVEYCPPNTEGGHAAALALFSRIPDVDAVFCFNDLVAVGVMQACAERGWSVPVDIAIIGADDIPLASLVRPALSTLSVDLRAIGTSATNMLLNLIDGENTASSKVKPTLVIRGSG